MKITRRSAIGQLSCLPFAPIGASIVDRRRPVRIVGKVGDQVVFTGEADDFELLFFALPATRLQKPFRTMDSRQVANLPAGLTVFQSLPGEDPDCKHEVLMKMDHVYGNVGGRYAEINKAGFFKTASLHISIGDRTVVFTGDVIFNSESVKFTIDRPRGQVLHGIVISGDAVISY